MATLSKQPAATAATATSTALPDRASPGGLLDVIDRPQQLLGLSAESFTHLVDEFLSRGAPIMAALKRGSGILAWAARHHLPDSHYGAWLHHFAETLGVSDDSVTRWRDRAITELGLPIPAVQEQRSRARLVAAARQIRARSADNVIELGDAPALREVVTRIASLSPEDLAESASTDELRGLKTLIDDAISIQQRTALHARLAVKDQTAKRGSRRTG